MNKYRKLIRSMRAIREFCKEKGCSSCPFHGSNPNRCILTESKDGTVQCPLFWKLEEGSDR